MPSQSSHNRSAQRGFTLVEMLVVAPIAILTIGLLVSLMVGLVGQTMMSTNRSSAAYNTQDALDRIEQDAKVAGAFLTTYSTFGSPQGRNGNTESFDTSKGDLIMGQQATTANPYTDTRQLVYYQNQPNPCASAGVNQVLPLKVVYFMKSDGSGTNTLWRRTIVRTWNSTNGAPDANTVCSAPWQRNSCPAGSTLNSLPCQVYDERILDNVSAFTPQYLLADGTVTTDATLAKTIRVTLTTQQQIVGDAQSNSMTLRVTRGNDIPTPPLPNAPTISVLNPSSNDYNNPVLSTFQWSATNATQFTYTYKIGAGAWSTPVSTTATTTGITTPNSNVAITIAVTATNASGSSTQTQFTYTTPVWTIPTLQNNWSNYANTYASVGYTKTSAGIILLKGLVQRSGSPVSGEAIFTLPPGCRPADDSMFLVGGVSAADRLDVHPAGLVQYITGGTAFLSLEAVAFIPAITSYTWTAGTLQSNWAPYVDASPWGTPGYTIDSLGRVFTKGLVKDGLYADGTPIMTLPVGYRSSEYLHLPTTSNNLFDATGVDIYGQVTTKGIGQIIFRSIQHNYYASGRATWTNLTLQNSWVVYPGYATPQYTKGSDGIVKVKGLIKWGVVTSGTVVANLPAGYRPAEVSLQSAACNMAYCRFDVQPNGNIVTRDNVSGTWSALEGITFLAEQ